MPKRRSVRQDAWANGGLAIVGRRTLTHFNEVIRPTLPRCGARAKSNEGKPCRQIAMANGRCRYHGGRSPSGADWHRHQFPAKAGPDVEKKLDRKLRQINRDKRAQAKRRREMAAEELQRHEAWHRDHQPGPAGKREMRRREKRTAAEFRRTADQERPEAPDVLALRAKAEAIEAERDRLLAEFNANDDRGCFG